MQRISSNSLSVNTKDRPVRIRAELLATNASDVLDVWAVLRRHAVDAPLADRVVTGDAMTAIVEKAHQRRLPLDGSHGPVKRDLLRGVLWVLHGYPL